jgi:hypothetical protein
MAAVEIELPVGATFRVESVQLSLQPRAGTDVLLLLTAAFLLPAIVLSVYAVQRRRSLSWLAAGLYTACLAAHSGLTMFLAGVGHNFDLDSWRIAAQVMGDGRFAYAGTGRYNYGALWAYLLHGAMMLHDSFRLASPESYHVLLAAIVCIANIAIITLLACYYELAAGVIYALLPPVIVVAGFHTQIDPLAIALLLAAWIIFSFRPRPEQTGPIVLAAVLCAVSLAAKHIALFLPLCVLICPRLGTLRQRILFAVVTYGLFFLHFPPFLLDEASRRNVIKYVFLYRSHRCTGIVPLGIRVCSARMEDILDPLHVYDMGWLVMILATCWWAVRQNIKHLAFFYLVAFCAFSPAVAHQYIVIPLSACALYYRYKSVWPYIVATSLFCLHYSSAVWPKSGFLNGIHTLGAVQPLLWIFLAAWFWTTWHGKGQDGHDEQLSRQAG